MAYGLTHDEDDDTTYKSSKEARSNLPVYGGASTPSKPAPRMAIPTSPPADPMAAAGYGEPVYFGASSGPRKGAVTAPIPRDPMVAAGYGEPVFFGPRGSATPAADPNRGEFSTGFEQGWLGTKGTLYGAAGAIGRSTGLGGLQQWGEAGAGEVEKRQQEIATPSSSFSNVLAGEEGATVGGFAKNIAGNALEVVAEGLVTAAATAAAGSIVPGVGTIAGGAGGLIAGTVNAIARNTAFRALTARAVGFETKKLAQKAAAEGVEFTAEQIADQAARNVAKYTIIGGAIGSGKAGVQGVGEVYNIAVEESERTGQPIDMAKVYAYGVGSGMMDAASSAFGISRLLKVGKGGTRISNAARGALAGTLTEGSTEGAQTVLGWLGGNKFNLDNLGDFVNDPNARRELVDSIAAGAGIGGLLGSAGGITHRGTRGAAVQAPDDLAGIPEQALPDIVPGSRGVPMLPAPSAAGIVPTTPTEGPSSSDIDARVAAIYEARDKVDLERVLREAAARHDSGQTTTPRVDVAAAIRELTGAAQSALDSIGQRPGIYNTIDKAQVDLDKLVPKAVANAAKTSVVRGLQPPPTTPPVAVPADVAAPPAANAPVMDAVAAPEAAFTGPTLPEPTTDITAQITAMMDPNNPKDSVFIAEGTPYPTQLPQGVMAAEHRGDGLYLTTNPDKARAILAGPPSDQTRADFLGIPEGKATVAATPEPKVMVTAEDAAGNATAQAVATPTSPNIAAVKDQTPPDGQTVVETIPDALAKRTAKAVAERAPTPAAVTEGDAAEAVIRDKANDLDLLWDSLPDRVKKLADKAVEARRLAETTEDGVLDTAALTTFNAFSKAVMRYLPAGITPREALSWYGGFDEFAGLEEVAPTVAAADTEPPSVTPPPKPGRGKAPAPQVEAEPQRYEYEKQKQGESPVEVEARNWVVDAMNGELPLPELIDRLRRTGLPEGTLLSITNRLTPMEEFTGAMQRSLGEPLAKETAASKKAKETSKRLQKEKEEAAKPKPEPTDLAAGAQAIREMEEEQRDNTEYPDMPGGFRAYGLYEAQNILPEPSDKIVRVTEKNSNTLYQDYFGIANVDGTLYGISKHEDPDAEGDEIDRNGDPKEFVYAYTRLDAPTTHVETQTSDPKELLAQIKGESDAVQKQGAAGVLQQESGQAGKAGRKRGRVEQEQQGKEAAAKDEGKPAEVNPLADATLISLDGRDLNDDDATLNVWVKDDKIIRAELHGEDGSVMQVSTKRKDTLSSILQKISEVFTTDDALKQEADAAIAEAGTAPTKETKQRTAEEALKVLRKKIRKKGKRGAAARSVAKEATREEREGLANAYLEPVFGKAKNVTLVDTPERYQQMSLRLGQLLDQNIQFFSPSHNAVNQMDGFSLPGDPDTVYVNINAQKPATFIVGHELGHNISEINPELWSRFMDEVIKLVDRKKFDKYLHNLKLRMEGEAKARGETRPVLTDIGAKTRDEVSADAVGAAFMDPEFWKLLHDSVDVEKRPLVLRVMEEFAALLRQVIAAVGSIINPNVVQKGRRTPEESMFKDLRAVNRRVRDLIVELRDLEKKTDAQIREEAAVYWDQKMEPDEGDAEYPWSKLSATAKDYWVDMFDTFRHGDIDGPELVRQFENVNAIEARNRRGEAASGAVARADAYDEAKALWDGKLAGRKDPDFDELSGDHKNQFIRAVYDNKHGGEASPTGMFDQIIEWRTKAEAGRTEEEKRLAAIERERAKEEKAKAAEKARAEKAAAKEKERKARVAEMVKTERPAIEERLQNVTPREQEVVARHYGASAWNEKVAHRLSKAVEQVLADPKALLRDLPEDIRPVIRRIVGGAKFSRAAMGYVGPVDEHGNPEADTAERQTDTVPFKAFFKDSKVVNDNGKPLIVYHHGSFATDEDNYTPNGPMHFGTLNAATDRALGKRVDDATAAVTAYEKDGRWHWEQGAGLERGRTSEDEGSKGFHAEERALMFGRSYARDLEEGVELEPEDSGVITGAFLSIQNPKRVRDVGDGDWAAEIEQAKAEGHDGIVYNNRYEDKGSTSYIAFEPGQVKSATENIGRFNPENPDIRYSRKGVAKVEGQEDKALAAIEKYVPTDDPSLTGLLYGKEKLKNYEIPKLGDQRGFAAALQRRAREIFGRKLDLANPDDRATVAKVMAKEIKAAMRRSVTAAKWYRENLGGALKNVAKVYPEIGASPTERSMFTLALAITSNGNDIDSNVALGIQSYAHYRKTGRFLPVGNGKEQEQMHKAFNAANELLARWGPEKFSQFLNSTFKVAELKRMGMEVSGEKAEREVYGSAMFGPKVGAAFYQNLNDNFDPLTMDRWFMRTIGRLTGTLIEDNPELAAKQANRFRAALQSASAKELQRFGIDPADAARVADMSNDELLVLAETAHRIWSTKEDYKNGTELSAAARTWDAAAKRVLDSPDNATHRNEIRDTTQQALALVNKGRKEKLSAGDVQALLWYPEKDLYLKYNATSSRGAPTDYEQATERFLDSDAGRRLTGAGSRSATGVQPQAATSGGVRQSPLKERERRRLIRGEIARQFAVANPANNPALTPYKSPRAYRARDRGSLAKDVRPTAELKPHVLQTYVPDRLYINAMEVAGVSTPAIHELQATPEAAQLFRDKLLAAVETQGAAGPQVTVYPAKSSDEGFGYDAFRLFLAHDGSAGFVIKPDGEVASLFKALPPEGMVDQLKSVSVSMLHAATQMGGRWLNAFDTYLPDEYAIAGFHAVSHIPFNTEYAPPGWDYKATRQWNDGKPNVVWMTYQDTAPEMYDPSQSKAFSIDDYDKAEAHAKKKIKKEPLRTLRGQVSFSRKDLLNPVEIVAVKGRKYVGKASFNVPNKTWFVWKAAPGGDIRDNNYTEQTVNTAAEAINLLREPGVRLIKRKEDPLMTAHLDPWGSGPDALYDIDTESKPTPASNWFVKKADAALKAVTGGRGEYMRRYLQQQMQDAFIDLKTLQQNLASKGGVISIANNVYQKITLYSGKTGEALDRFKKKFVDPTMEQIEAAYKKGATLKDIETFLIAQHAEERNQQIEQRTQGKNTAGSGMTTQDARNHLRAYASAPYAAELQAIGKIADDVSTFKVDTMEKSGLISAEAATELRKYQHYRPLKGLDKDDSREITGGLGVGSGFSGKASTLKYALGRDTESSSTISHMFLDAEAKIVRAGKNEVAVSLAQLANDFPDPNFWVVNQMKVMKSYDPETGTITYRADNFRDKNTVVAWQNGNAIVIDLKNDSFAQAVTNAGAAGSSILFEYIRRWNRYLSMMMTTLNPEWGLVNAARDAQTAFLNISADNKLPAGIAKKVMADLLLLRKHKDIYKAVTDPDYQGGFGQWYQELAQMGGITRFFGLDTLEDRVRKLQNMEARVARKDWRGVAMNAFQKSYAGTYVKVLEDVNATIEAAPRVLTYKALVDAGWSKERAADYAKNLTTNFNRKGANQFLSSWYLFFNPAVQGSARIFEALATPQGKMIATSLFGMGLAAGLTGNSGGDDDKNGIPDYQQLSDWDRAMNIILWPNGPKIPLPYGWNAFYAAGNYVSDAFFGRSPMDASWAGFKAAANSFNPLGGSDSKSALGWIGKTVTPTIGDPLLEYLMNENRFGGEIRRTQDKAYGPKQPESQMGGIGATAGSKALTGTLNEWTGGSAAKPGLVDMNPDSVDWFFGGIFPGVPTTATRFASTLYKMGAGEQTETKDYPFYRRVVAEPNRGKIAEALKEAKGQIKEFQNIAKRGDPEERAELAKTHPGWGGVDATFTVLTKQTSALYKRKAAIIDGKIDVTDEAAEKNRIDKQIEELNNRMLKRYNEAAAKW